MAVTQTNNAPSSLPAEAARRSKKARNHVDAILAINSPEATPRLAGESQSPLPASSGPAREMNRAFLLKISDDNGPELRTFAAPADRASRSENSNHFTWGGSQLNTDLAAAADGEHNDDPELSRGDADGLFCDAVVSPMYQNLRQAFIEEALREKGSSYALVNLVIRAYNAGRLSPTGCSCLRLKNGWSDGSNPICRKLAGSRPFSEGSRPRGPSSEGLCLAA